MIKKLLNSKPPFYTRNLLLAAMGSFIFSTAGATDWFVNDASLTGDVFTTAIGNDANAGTAAAPFATIQAALAAAANGDFIYVDAGTYVTADIEINKSISLRGAKYGIPAGPDNIPANRGTNETIIEGSIYYGQSRDNISVDGFTVNRGTGLRGIEARGLNSVVINNILTGTITPAVQQIGISTRANAPNRLHSYTIANNNVRGFRYGIFMDGNTENASDIRLNYVTGCFTAGYVFTASNGHHIDANIAEANGQGMVFTEGNNLIENNTIIGNAVSGIRLAATPQTFGNIIIHNFFINNPIGINLTEDDAASQNNSANYNSFTGGAQAIVNAHTANFNATCNWFGTDQAALIALQLNGSISFNPFLTDGTDTDVAPGFQPTTSCIVLPVVLLDFTAAVKKYDVQLSWQTASEVNSSHFVVERSLDNQQYTAIGNVAAKGFSSSRNNYGFLDNKPVNFDKPTYYRLAMVDRDGTKKYSKIISVTLKTSGSFVQQVYPNPARAGNILTTDFISGSVQTVTMIFVNATGQALGNYKFQAVKGVNKFKINIPANAAAGVNFIQIRTTEEVKQVPVYIHQ